MDLVPIIVGPICASITNLGLMLDSFNFLAISYQPIKSTKQIFSFNKNLATFAYSAIPRFAKSQQWKRIFLISETFDYWSSREIEMADGLNRENISLEGVIKVPTTVGLPDLKYFDEAAQQLAQKRPRIIIVLTSFATYLACSLYKAGLYGKHVVYLSNISFFFQTNDPSRPPNCTEQMLVEILKSVNVFSPASPINMDPKYKDGVELSSEMFDKRLKQAIGSENSQDSRVWFNFRSAFYSGTVGTALVLDKIERQLQFANDSLLNWLSSGVNFQTNGNFIRNMIQQEMTDFSYNALDSYPNIDGDDDKDSPDVGIYQMQLNPTKGVTSFFMPVLVGTYRENQKILKIDNSSLKWRNLGNNPPLDSAIIVQSNVEIFGKGSGIFFLTFSTASLIVMPLILFTVHKKAKNETNTFQKSIEFFQYGFSIGSFSIALFIFLIAVANFTGFSSCSLHISAIACLIYGVWIWIFSLLAIFKMANIMRSVAPSKLDGFSLKMTLSGKIKLKISTQIVNRTQCGQINYRLSKIRKSKIKLVLIVPFSMAIIAIIWQTSDPMVLKRLHLHSTIQNESGTIEEKIYETYANVCQLGDKSSTFFILFFITNFVFLLIRIVYFDFTVRKIPKTVIPSINALKNVTFTTTTIFALGTTLILLVFKNNPISTATATVSLATIILSLQILHQVKTVLL